MTGEICSAVLPALSLGLVFGFVAGVLLGSGGSRDVHLRYSIQGQGSGGGGSGGGIRVMYKVQDTGGDHSQKAAKGEA